MMESKFQKANRKGHELENHIHSQIRNFLLWQTSSPNGNYQNLKLTRPLIYKGRKYHEKAFIELDNSFYFRGILWNISCKRRRGVNRKGQDNCFWIKSQFFATELYYDGRNCTAEYLANIWQSEKYIKSNKIYQFHGNPLVKGILLIDAPLRTSKSSIPYGYVQDILICTKAYFPEFLKKLATLTQKNNIMSPSLPPTNIQGDVNE